MNLVRIKKIEFSKGCVCFALFNMFRYFMFYTWMIVYVFYCVFFALDKNIDPAGIFLIMISTLANIFIVYEFIFSLSEDYKNATREAVAPGVI